MNYFKRNYKLMTGMEGAGKASPGLMAAQAAGDVISAGLGAYLSEVNARKARREARRQFERQMALQERAQMMQEQQARAALEARAREFATTTEMSAPGMGLDNLSKLAGLKAGEQDWRQNLINFSGAL